MTLQPGAGPLPSHVDDTIMGDEGAHLKRTHAEISATGKKPAMSSLARASAAIDAAAVKKKPAVSNLALAAAATSFPVRSEHSPRAEVRTGGDDVLMAGRSEVWDRAQERTSSEEQIDLMPSDVDADSLSGFFEEQD